MIRGMTTTLFWWYLCVWLVLAIVVPMAIMFLITSAHAFSCRVPPARYDHVPSQPYRIIQDPTLRGNAFADPHSNTIIIPQNASHAWKSCYIRHEQGHLNGWDEDHGRLRHVPYPGH